MFRVGFGDWSEEFISAVYGTVHVRRCLCPCHAEEWMAMDYVYLQYFNLALQQSGWMSWTLFWLLTTAGT